MSVAAGATTMPSPSSGNDVVRVNDDVVDAHHR